MGLYLDVDVSILLQTLSQQVITHSGKSKKVGHHKPKKVMFLKFVFSLLNYYFFFIDNVICSNFKL